MKDLNYYFEPTIKDALLGDFTICLKLFQIMDFGFGFHSISKTIPKTFIHEISNKFDFEICEVYNLLEITL